MNIFSNIGITELIFILLLVLVVFGPDRLPELARTLGKVMRDFRNIYTNLTRDMGPEMAEIQRATKEVRDTVGAVRDIPKTVTRSVLATAEMEAMKDDLDKARQAAATLADPRKLLEPATAEAKAIQDDLDRARQAAEIDRALAPPEPAATPAPEAALPGAGPAGEAGAVPVDGDVPIPQEGAADDQPVLFEPGRAGDDPASGAGAAPAGGDDSVPQEAADDQPLFSEPGHTEDEERGDE